jgi:hypothetical protein
MSELAVNFAGLELKNPLMEVPCDHLDDVGFISLVF